MTGTNALSREKIFEIAQSLPPAPKVLAGLGELLKDVNVDLDRVAELIKRDTALAAHIIRISNSVLYGASGEIKIGTVEDAVNRVGFREIYRLVGLATTTRLVDRMLKYYDVPTAPLRANMLYTALVCEALAEASGLDARMAYTAGLMRTLGILVLDRVADLLSGVEKYNHEAIGSYVLWEGRVFLFSNCEVAGMILTEWGFPTETVEAVRDHYLQREDDYENRLACLLNVAGGIVAASGNALPGEYGYWETTPRKLQILKLTTRQISKASERAQRDFEVFRTHIDLGPQKPSPGLTNSELSRDSTAPFAVPDASEEVSASGTASWLGSSEQGNRGADAELEASRLWGQPFPKWPILLRAAFLALTVALGAGLTLAGIEIFPRALPVVQSFAAPFSRLRFMLAFIVDLGPVIAHSLPPFWVHSLTALLFTFYTALFGISVAAYRILVLNR